MKNKKLLEMAYQVTLKEFRSIGKEPPSRDEVYEITKKNIEYFGEEIMEIMITNPEVRKDVSILMDKWVKFRTGGKIGMIEFIKLMNEKGKNFAQNELDRFYKIEKDKNRDENLI